MRTLIILLVLAAGCYWIWRMVRKLDEADEWKGPKAMLAEGREMVAIGRSLVAEGSVAEGECMIREGEKQIQRARNLLPDELEE
jgi:hypothetical protein